MRRDMLEVLVGEAVGMARLLRAVQKVLVTGEIPPADQDPLGSALHGPEGPVRLLAEQIVGLVGGQGLTSAAAAGGIAGLGADAVLSVVAGILIFEGVDPADPVDVDLARAVPVGGLQ